MYFVSFSHIWCLPSQFLSSISNIFVSLCLYLNLLHTTFFRLFFFFFWFCVFFFYFVDLCDGVCARFRCGRICFFFLIWIDCTFRIVDMNRSSSFYILSSDFWIVDDDDGFIFHIHTYKKLPTPILYYDFIWMKC